MEQYILPRMGENNMQIEVMECDVINYSQPRSKYPKESGLYLVDDGMTYGIVMITDDTPDSVVPMVMVIPRESLNMATSETELARWDKVGKQIDDLIVAVKSNVVVEPAPQQGVDMEAITKLVAVAQDAKVYK